MPSMRRCANAPNAPMRQCANAPNAPMRQCANAPNAPMRQCPPSMPRLSKAPLHHGPMPSIVRGLGLGLGLELLRDHLVREQLALLHAVGLDAVDEVRGRRLQLRHQRAHVEQEAAAGGGRDLVQRRLAPQQLARLARLVSGAMARYSEMQRGIARYSDMQRGIARCSEMQRGIARCRETWRDMRRYALRASSGRRPRPPLAWAGSG